MASSVLPCNEVVRSSFRNLITPTLLRKKSWLWRKPDCQSTIYLFTWIWDKSLSLCLFFLLLFSVCSSCYHLTCFNKRKESCPKCARVDARWGGCGLFMSTYSLRLFSSALCVVSQSCDMSVYVFLWLENNMGNVSALTVSHNGFVAHCIIIGV